MHHILYFPQSLSKLRGQSDLTGLCADLPHHPHQAVSFLGPGFVSSVLNWTLTSPALLSLGLGLSPCSRARILLTRVSSTHPPWRGVEVSPVVSVFRPGPPRPPLLLS